MHVQFERFLPSPETSDIDRGKFYGTRVEWDSDYGLISIVDEQVTSLNPTARRLEGGDHQSVQFTPAEIRWLFGVLGELIAVMPVDVTPPAPTAGGESGRKR